MYDCAILGGDNPAVGAGVKLSCNDPSVKRDIFSDVELLVNVVEVGSELGPIGETLGPCPPPPELLHGKLVDGEVRVHTGARIAVPVPGATERGTCFEDFSGEAKQAEVVKLMYPRKTGADNEGVEGLYGSVRYVGDI
jgi:hypothetical protein